MKIKNTASSEPVPQSVLGIPGNDSRDGGGRVTQEAKTEAGIEWHLLKGMSPYFSSFRRRPESRKLPTNEDSGSRPAPG